MSDPNDSTARSTVDDGRTSLSSIFLDFCAKVRNNDPFILPEPDNPLRIRRLIERDVMEVADDLPENTNVTYRTFNWIRQSLQKAL
jgi:hypothetical protein